MAGEAPDDAMSECRPAGREGDNHGKGGGRMSEGSGVPEGPDLGQGVALTSLREGVPFRGRFDGEAVVLVRGGETVHAIGGTCTHYGGPLAEGLVVGETIRCPWHHACFSLRTGEALGAPALNPVPCFRVETVDGMVRVTAKDELGPLEPTGTPETRPESVVIVGAGAAGSAAAEMLRREGYTGPITLIDGEAAAPYDRPNLSKDYLAGNAPEEWIPLRPGGFYTEHGIDRIVEEVRSLDLEGRNVTTTSGRTIGFGALLLATGATPIRLRIPGSDLPHVRVLRSWDDARAIIERAESGGRAVVLGASFIGMEVAASLSGRGMRVTVVAPEEVPFERSLGPELGRVLLETHERNGVTFLLGRTAVEVGPKSVRTSDGIEVPAELVVAGIGVRPNTGLAEAAGLEVENGVVVDGRLETSVPGIFAAGDIARYPDPLTGEMIRVEHWVAAQRQGQAVARSILGHQETFAHPPFFWTHQWDVVVDYVGHATSWDEIHVEGELSAGDAAIRYVKEGGERAVATIGRDLESLRVEAAMESVAVAAERGNEGAA